jgi:hypothetical protein
MSTLIACHRSGTKTNMALMKLYALAGAATLIEWRKALKWNQPAGLFDTEVIFPLVQHGMVFRRRDNWYITDSGKRAIGIDPDVSCGGGEIVPPPAAPATYRPPLSRPSLLRTIPIRDGALDFLDIPSRHGDQSIPHRKA